MWRVLLWNTQHASAYVHVVRAIEDAFAEQPEVSGVWSADDSDALPLARKNHCNLLLAVGGGDLDLGLCCRLKHVCGASALWAFVGPAGTPVSRPHLSALFDRMFSTDPAVMGHCDPPVTHLPLAASRRFHEYQIPADIDESSHYRYDLLIVGSATPSRRELLKQLLAAASDLRIKLALQADDDTTSAGLDLPASIYSWRAPSGEIARMANRSRAVLLLGGEAVQGHESHAAPVLDSRAFELALAGAFLLVDASLVETARFYEVAREIVTFDGAEDCLGKLRVSVHGRRD